MKPGNSTPCAKGGKKSWVRLLFFCKPRRKCCDSLTFNFYLALFDTIAADEYRMRIEKADSDSINEESKCDWLITSRR